MKRFIFILIVFQPKDLYMCPWYKNLFWWLHIHVNTITQGPWHSYLRYTTNSYTSTFVWGILIITPAYVYKDLYVKDFL